jgi:hypothetical protein
LGEEGEKFLIGFSPLGVVLALADVLGIIYYNFLVEKDEEREGREKFVLELSRWKAAEIIKRTEQREAERSNNFFLDDVSLSYFASCSS